MLKLKHVLILLAFTFAFCAFQLYRYNTTEQPVITKVYRYKNNKLISSEAYVNDAVKCKEN